MVEVGHESNKMTAILCTLGLPGSRGKCFGTSPYTSQRIMRDLHIPHFGLKGEYVNTKKMISRVLERSSKRLKIFWVLYAYGKRSVSNRFWLYRYLSRKRLLNVHFGGFPHLLLQVKEVTFLTIIIAIHQTHVSLDGVWKSVGTFHVKIWWLTLQLWLSLVVHTSGENLETKMTISHKVEWSRRPLNFEHVLRPQQCCRKGSECLI